MLFRSKTTQSESLHSWHSPIHKNIHTLMIKAVASFWGFYLLRTVHPIYFIFTKLTLQQWLGDRDLNSSHSKNTYNTHTHTYKQQQTFVDRLNLQYNSYWNFYATLRHLSCIFHSSLVQALQSYGAFPFTYVGLSWLSWTQHVSQAQQVLTYPL